MGGTSARLLLRATQTANSTKAKKKGFKLHSRFGKKNYIIFRNAEIFKKKCFSQRKNNNNL
jgi:hypothetical protein